MGTLTVWRFDEATGADAALSKLENLDAQEVIEIEDAAVIRWPKEAPAAETAEHATGGKMDGVVKRLKHSGIEDSFVQSLEEKVTPGTSALFLLSEHAVLDRVADAFSETKMELIESNLSDDQEREVREAFREETDLHLGPLTWKR